MTRSILIPLVLAACGSDKAPATPEAETGPLTIKRVMAMAMDKTPLPLCVDTWDVAFAKLQKKLGPPQKIDGDKFIWAVAEADTCATVYVERGECPPAWNKPGPRLYMQTEPVTTTAAGPNEFGNHELCVATAKGSGS